MLGAKKNPPGQQFLAVWCGSAEGLRSEVEQDERVGAQEAIANDFRAVRGRASILCGASSEVGRQLTTLQAAVAHQLCARVRASPNFVHPLVGHHHARDTLAELEALLLFGVLASRAKILSLLLLPTVDTSIGIL